MIAFPNSKINLGLRVLEKRTDGFHNIETIFYPVQWLDVIEALPLSEVGVPDHNDLPSVGVLTNRDELSFETKGLKIDGNESENLCVKAFQLLRKEFEIPAVKMCLLKNIPVGSGLGGGSSDAAFTLKLLNDLFDLKISTARLKEFAAQLGSDCAFFIENKPCLATGRGDELHHFELILSSYHIMIVVPTIQVSTAWAYQSVGSRQYAVPKNRDLRFTSISKKKLQDIVRQAIESWGQELKNDFEEIVFSKHPEIAEIKNQLYDNGALYASISGSGSALFGIFKEEPSEISFPNNYKIFRGRL